MTTNTPEKHVHVHGVGFLSLLTLLFIGLRLVGVINWSWLWVLSPILIPLGVAITIGIVAVVVSVLVGLVLGIVNVVDDRRKRKPFREAEERLRKASKPDRELEKAIQAANDTERILTLIRKSLQNEKGKFN